MIAVEDRFVPVADGLKLHVRDWRPDESRGAPVACLPGLARTLEDFVALAERLSERGRRVVAISARGRGLSDRDPDPSRYQLKIEAEDALLALGALGVDRAHVVGTSRGGLQAMMIAALRPSALASVVLNDIGPVIEADGLKAIGAAVGRMRAPVDFIEGARWIARANADRFPALRPEDYDRWARRAWRETNTGLELACDPALARIFDGVDLEAPQPPLWELFDALASTPLMVVRGEHSDILGVGTVREIEARRSVVVWTTAGQGHAPLLDDEPTMAAIDAFLESVDS